MIKVCVEDGLQVTTLEYEVMRNGIEYRLIENAPDCGLGYPYLIVDGVPLDEERAMTWIKGRCENE